MRFYLLNSLLPEADRSQALCRGPQVPSFSVNRDASVAAQVGICRRRRRLGTHESRKETLGIARCSDKAGAPGWNRTSDTRFRKPTEAVTDHVQPDAIVLHGPRF